MDQSFLDKDLELIVHEQGIGCAIVRSGDREFSAFFDNAPATYSEIGQLVLGAPELLCYPADAVGIDKGAVLSIAVTGEPFVQYKVSSVGRQRWGLTTLQLTKDKMRYDS